MLSVISPLLLALLESRQVLELRAASKGGWASGLKGASKQKLRGEERSKLHIKRSARCSHVVCIGRCGLILIHGLSVERRNVAATGVTVSKSRYVGRKGTVRESSVAIRRL